MIVSSSPRERIVWRCESHTPVSLFLDSSEGRVQLLEEYPWFANKSTSDKYVVEKKGGTLKLQVEEQNFKLNLDCQISSVNVSAEKSIVAVGGYDGMVLFLCVHTTAVK